MTDKPTKQERITIALNESDRKAMIIIRNYLANNRPDSKITTTDVIRYALTMAAVAIQEEAANA